MTRGRVNLLSRDEKACLEFSDGRPDRANWATSSAETLEQTFGLAREPLQLPPIARNTNRENRGPQGPVNKRALTVKKLCEENVGMINELRQGGEDEASLGMAPPGGMKGLTRENSDHAWECLVLLEEKTFAGKD